MDANEEEYVMTPTQKKNKALKMELWKKGYYVIEVGQEKRPDYLVVSCAPPESLKKIKSTSS